ncbi:MAG: PKD domain-containing protein [Flavobacteriales bacterium]|nr:PKD domain-containing protein [Flavobacteriales bacterium]
MIRHIAAIFALLSSTWSLATHVLGGEMYYDHLTGDQYRITLKLYRDCGPGNVNGTGFDTGAQLAIYDGNGILQFTETANFPGEESVPVELNNPCLAAPDGICASWAEYEAILTLPANTSGYVIGYQRCCRTPTIINLPTGLLQGLTCTVQVPPAANGTNSSPRFNEYPPIVLCLDQDMAFDHSATDPDGDVLVYDLYTPFAGGDEFDPAPLASPPPYAGILWASGYAGTSPMDGVPGLAIDPATGELTVHPTLLGSFAVGVRVREFRNGVQLSESIRDLRFDVVPCNVTVISSIQEQQQFCTGYTVEMENQSINGQFWHWDFGVNSQLNDTSDLTAPTWTYADTGSYVITLIANPGWPCADTSTSVFEVHPPLDPYFERPPIRCTNEMAELVVQGIFTNTAAVSWDFGDGASPVSALGHIVSTEFAETGAHPITVSVVDFGCEQSYTDSVVVYPRPQLTAVTDRAGCAGVLFAFEAEGIAWTAVRYAWNFGDGTTASEEMVSHVFELPGVYDIVVTAATDSGCIDQSNLVLNNWVEVFPIPEAAFIVEPDEVSLLDPRIEVQDFAHLAQAWEYAIDGIIIHDPNFIYEFDDAGTFEITQTVISGENCTHSISRTVYVIDHLFYAPTVFTPDGDGLNDTWAPSVQGARLYELVVFDRWGVERFRTNDTKAQWSGDGLPQGVYSFQAQVAEYGAYSKEYRGTVTLLR